MPATNAIYARTTMNKPQPPTPENQSQPQQKRVAGNFDYYEQRGARWICKTCCGEIKAVICYCPVWDGPGPCSGSGEVVTNQVPFCPNCEEKPNVH